MLCLDHSFSHAERRMKAVYHITRVDPSVFLVLVLEGKRRPSDKAVQDFLVALTEGLQHAAVFRAHAADATVDR